MSLVHFHDFFFHLVHLSAVVVTVAHLHPTPQRFNVQPPPARTPRYERGMQGRVWVACRPRTHTLGGVPHLQEVRRDAPGRRYAAVLYQLATHALVLCSTTTPDTLNSSYILCTYSCSDPPCTVYPFSHAATCDSTHGSRGRPASHGIMS